MMAFRRIIFWIHLVAGVIAGVVIAIMSATGVAIAFEEEILAWFDRKVSRIEKSHADAESQPLEVLLENAATARPAFPVDYLRIPRDPTLAIKLYSNWEGPVYLNPYTGELKDSEAETAHHWIHVLEEWHRWLGMSGDWFPVGRLITGVCNIAFVVLCVTGLYLWWPRKWSRRALRPKLWFVGQYRGKARNYNWHNVIGFWSLPVLLVLALTAVVISFAWGHRLVFTLFGEEAPEARNYGMMAVPPAVVPTPPPGSEPAPLALSVAAIQEEFPNWTWIDFYFDSDKEATQDGTIPPLEAGVTVPDYMPSRAYAPIELNPFTGEILQATRFEERSAALQTRVWIRFLHTGGAFGFWGKLIASVATTASLVLVYTGFALSWRRLNTALRKKAEV